MNWRFSNPINQELGYTFADEQSFCELMPCNKMCSRTSTELLIYLFFCHHRQLSYNSNPMDSNAKERKLDTV